MEYNEFKVQVKNKSDRSIVLSPETPAISFKIDHNPLYEKIIQIFIKWLKDNDDKSRAQEDVKIFGTILFRVIFNTEMEEQFRAAYDKIRKIPSIKLRVILEFDKRAEVLAVWPWEYIYLPDHEDHGKGFFIAADEEIVLARQVPIKIGDLEKSDNLNILIIESRPTISSDENEEDPGIIISDGIIDQIEKLKEPGRVKVNIKLIDAPTKAKLKDVVDEYYKKNQKFNIVHFIGHGKYVPAYQDQNEGGYLGFTSPDDPETISWLSDGAFAECFKNKEPRLIFLNACQGAMSQSYESFRGMALQLVFSRIPAVVAMQYPVTNGVAIKFANKFYNSLCEGKDIDVAVQDGRLEIGWYSDNSQNFTNRDFGSPVVYLQKEDGLIIATGDEKKSPREPEPLICPKCRSNVDARQVICGNPSCRSRLKPCPSDDEETRCGGKPFSIDLGYCIWCGYEDLPKQGIPQDREVQTSRKDDLHRKSELPNKSELSSRGESVKSDGEEVRYGLADSSSAE